MVKIKDSEADKDLAKVFSKKERTKYNNLKKVGDFYWVDFFKKDKGRLQRSTGEKSITRANDIKIDMINEFLGQKKRRKLIHQPLIQDLVPQHLEYKKKVDRVRTHQSREEKFRLYLVPFFGGYTLNEVTKNLWEEYLVWLAQYGVNAGQSRKHLVTFLSWCAEEKDIDFDTVPTLRNPDPDAEEGRVYSLEEMSALHREAKSEGDEFYLHFLMSSTMYTRANENNIPKDRVKLRVEPPQIHLRKEDTKTKQPRKFAISPECLPLIEKQIKSSSSPFLFPHPDDPERPQYREWYTKPWERVKERAEVTGRARFHDLRHTAITFAFKKWPHLFIMICEAAGLDPKVAKKVYLHLTPKDTAVVMSPMGEL